MGKHLSSRILLIMCPRELLVFLKDQGHWSPGALMWAVLASAMGGGGVREKTWKHGPHGTF